MDTFLQLEHLHKREQPVPALKHSQYFLTQPVFEQLQPLECKTLDSALFTYLYLDLNANGFFSSVSLIT